MFERLAAKLSSTPLKPKTRSAKSYKPYKPQTEAGDVCLPYLKAVIAKRNRAKLKNMASAAADKTPAKRNINEDLLSPLEFTELDTPHKSVKAPREPTTLLTPCKSAMLNTAIVATDACSQLAVPEVREPRKKLSFESKAVLDFSRQVARNAELKARGEMMQAIGDIGLVPITDPKTASQS